jgi:hypothetical protein
MKWCLFKKEGPPEIYTPKAISKTLDAIQTEEDLLRFIHKKVSKGVYPKNHVLKGPYKRESSEYYIALYLTDNAPKRYTEDDHWILWTFDKPESVVETAVLFKIDNDDTKTMIRRTSNSLTLEEAHRICCCNKPAHEESGGDPGEQDELEDQDELEEQDELEDQDELEEQEDDEDDIDEDEEDDNDEDIDEDEEDDNDEDVGEEMDKKCIKKSLKKAIKIKAKIVSDNKKPVNDETIDLVMDVNDDLEYESYDYEASFIPIQKH